MAQNKALVLIPARFQSSRFPGKPLAQIAGKSMISQVYQNLSSDKFKAVVVTDDEKIESHVKEFGEVVRVDDDVPSGTQRIALALERFYQNDYDIIVNVQGDEPLLNALEIEKLIEFHSNHDFEITTLLKPENSFEDFKDPNRVKAVFSKETGECHYFSRSPIPFDRDQKMEQWHLHIGVYCFSKESLMKLATLPESSLEKKERLEQLRAIESGMRIGAIETDTKLFGVDTPEDIKKVEEVINGQS